MSDEATGNDSSVTFNLRELYQLEASRQIAEAEAQWQEAARSKRLREEGLARARELALRESAQRHAVASLEGHAETLSRKHAALCESQAETLRTFRDTQAEALRALRQHASRTAVSKSQGASRVAFVLTAGLLLSWVGAGVWAGVLSERVASQAADLSALEARVVDLASEETPVLPGLETPLALTGEGAVSEPNGTGGLGSPEPPQRHTHLRQGGRPADSKRGVPSAAPARDRVRRRAAVRDSLGQVDLASSDPIEGIQK